MKVTDLRIYPIKSTAPLFIKKAKITKTGLQYDRIFALFDDAGQALTARNHPQLLTISTRIRDEHCLICMEDEEIATVPLSPEKRSEINVRIHRYSATGYPVNESLDDWFSEFLGIRCSLLRFDPTCQRRVIPTHGGMKEDRVNFSDQAPILIISEGSMEDLNSRLDHSIPIDRFRPNIIVSGCAPYEEDQWQTIVIGDQNFRVIQQCERCIFTTINTSTLLKDPRGEPLRTLSKYRKGPLGGVVFGVHAVPIDVADHSIQIGDEISVLNTISRTVSVRR